MAGGGETDQGTDDIHLGLGDEPLAVVEVLVIILPPAFGIDGETVDIAEAAIAITDSPGQALDLFVIFPTALFDGADSELLGVILGIVEDIGQAGDVDIIGDLDVVVELVVESLGKGLLAVTELAGLGNEQIDIAFEPGGGEKALVGGNIDGTRIEQAVGIGGHGRTFWRLSMISRKREGTEWG